jgi:CheY-like chemotaxis protein
MGLFEAVKSPLAAIMRSKDWSTTPLGPAEAWPAPLCSAVELCLNMRSPAIIWWGPDRLMFYNDAQGLLMGSKRHPAALARPAREAWPEQWEQFSAALVSAERREAVSSEGSFLIDRASGTEERFFRFSYSPIPSNGAVGGILGVGMDTTGPVLGERRLRLLNLIAQQTGGAISEADACAAAAAAISAFPAEVPFALFYLSDPDGRALRCAAAAGLVDRPAEAALEIPMVAGALPWRMDAVFTGAERVVLADLAGRDRFILGDVAFRPAPRQACVCALPGPRVSHPAGCLVAGLNPHRALDAEARAFIEVMAARVSHSIAQARRCGATNHQAALLPSLDELEHALARKIGHELRTPLSAIIGWAQVLERHAVDALTLARGLAVIERNAMAQKRALDDLVGGRFAPSVAPAASPTALLDRPRLSGVLVVVVDDDPDGRELAAYVLTAAGAEVHVAASSDQGLDAIQQHRPDLIVSDIELSGEDGYAFIRRVRALPDSAGGRTPAVALTGRAETEDRQLALRAGYQMHLAKPVDEAELLTVCASLTGRLQ